jgi:hypothetical protein
MSGAGNYTVEGCIPGDGATHTQLGRKNQGPQVMHDSGSGETGAKRQRASPNERRVRALGDVALIAAMRAGDDWAFGEFIARFRPGLAAYARGRIPDELIPECVDEVLEDEALALSNEDAVVPTRLSAYLVGAARKRHLALRRSSERRLRWYEEAARSGRCTSDGREHVVRSVCAESTIAASAGAQVSTETAEPSAIEQLALAIEGELDEETRRLLAWIGQAVPHRQIAEWLGKSYDATTKQIWRLCRRLEQKAPAHAEKLPREVRHELERFFRRVERGRRGG